MATDSDLTDKDTVAGRPGFWGREENGATESRRVPAVSVIIKCVIRDRIGLCGRAVGAFRLDRTYHPFTIRINVIILAVTSYNCVTSQIHYPV